MNVTSRILLGVGIAFGACMMTTPAPATAQSTAKQVETTVHKATKTTKHNLKSLGHTTRKAAHSTTRATANAVVGHRILCGDGTWASRDNPTCSDHDGVATRQPEHKDKDK
jgi:phosphoenolpyruvate-protein kinase (PTS system EI component)